MLEAQDFKCALCRRHKDSFKRGYALAVDHCHETGKVRGLLCCTCNRLLIKDRDLDFFKRGVAYLS